MPWEIKKSQDEWTVRNTETGRVRGRHTSYTNALKQMRLLWGVKEGWQPTGRESVLKRKRYLPK